MQTVIATFDDPQTAQHAVDRLVAQGFSRQQVHVEAASASAWPAGTDTPSATDTTTPGVTSTGGTSATGTSAGSRGAVRDSGVLASVGNFFSNLFESNTEDAGKYAEAVRRGSTVVIVDANTDREVTVASDLMADLGAIDLEERAQTWRSQGWTGYDAGAQSADEEAAFARQSVPVVQEELRVGKRTVNVGSLRVIKRVSETPVSQIVKLRQERATIERRAVDREATEADFKNFREGIFEVRETAEEAVIGKTARVVEEVVVGREATERAETISDTVRRTHVDVERMPNADANIDPTVRPEPTMRAPKA